MEKSLSKFPVSIILLLAGITISILLMVVEPDDDKIYFIGTITYILLITASIVGIFTTKTDNPKVKKEEQVIDEKYQKKYDELRDLKWIANALFILCAFEAVILVCVELGDSLWGLLQINFGINFIAAFVMRMSISKEKSKLEKQMKEDEKVNGIINILSNLEISISCEGNDEDEEQSKSM